MSASAPNHPYLIAAEFLSTVLRSDQVLLEEFGEAIWEGIAPEDSPAPYLVYRDAMPLAPNLIRQGAHIIWTTVYVQVSGWVDSPPAGSGDIRDLARGLARVRQLLHGHQGALTTEFPGVVNECIEEFAYVPEPYINAGGVVKRGLGSRYRLRVTADDTN